MLMQRFVLLLLCFAVGSHAIVDRMFTINSRLPKTCGLHATYKPHSKVTPWGDWPWLGLLSYKSINSNKCNVILIHQYVAVTAMPCIRDGDSFVEFSNHALPSFQKIQVASIHSNNNKFALLRLKKSVLFSEKVQPLCIWEENNDYSSQLESSYGLVIGTEFTDTQSDALSTYQVPTIVIGKEDCKKHDRSFYDNNLQDSVCLSYFQEPLKCHHFGSALIFPKLSRDGDIVWYLRGIQTQRVFYCAQGKYVPSYDIAAHRAWIESHFKASIESSCGRRIIPFTELATLGYEATRGDWPWHISIHSYKPEDNNFEYKCGGSLISKKYVLTAGHCVLKKGDTVGQVEEYIYLRIALGKHNLYKKENGAAVRNVSRIIIHEQFNRTNLANDIALIELSSEVIFNQYIRSVCLWEDTNLSKTNIFNKVGKVPGWGANENDKYPSTMFVATMPIVPDVDCYQRDSFYFQFLTEKTLCAGNPRGNGTNVCNGDSGGGLVLPIVQDDNVVTWYIRGIVSLAKPNQISKFCDPDYYSIFTDVAKYLDWIKTSMA